MGRLLHKTSMILTCGLFIIALSTPSSASISTDEEEDRCIIAARTSYMGDDVHADLYISDVTYEDGELYLNGEPYPKAVEKRISKLLGKVEKETKSLPEPPGSGNGPPPHAYLNQLSPVLHPVIKGVMGPVVHVLEEADLEDPPVVQVEIRLPSQTDEVEGQRVALMINTPFCISELEP